MTRRQWGFSVAVVLLCCVQTTYADQVDDYVRGFIQRHQIPGISIAVVHHGKLVKAAGYGMANLELSVPATQNTLYEIGSISKQFTAEAVMMLVEEGKLQLTDPIGKFLPEAPAAWARITVAELLTHTSGLKDWEAAGILTYRREYTPKEYIDLIAAQPLDFAPGTRWAYTNSSYPLLGLIIERVSGKPFEQFVEERIFKLAEMPTARLRHPEQIVPNRASGYIEAQGELRNGEPLRPGIIAPNGGIMASAVDMARWDIALHSGLLLKPALVQQMMTIVRLNDGKPGISGMAWFADTFHGHRMVLHNGSTLGGFSSVVYHYLDDDLGIAVLCNIDRWNAVNVVAEHLAGMFVPGVSVMSLPGNKADEARTTRMLQFMSDLAAGKDPDLLAPNLRGNIWTSFRRTVGENLEVRRKFELVDYEDFGATGAERFGEVIRSIERYRLETGTKAVYYSFEFTREGKITRMVPEED